MLRNVACFLACPSHYAPSADDFPVVAHPDLAAPCESAMLMQGQIQRSFRAHRRVGRSVPAHERFAIPEP